jgi:hypothetical protein
MQKLKKWHRLGIVLSIIWIIYSVSISRNEEMERNNIFRDMDVQTCREEKRDFKVCLAEAWNKSPDNPYWSGHLANALLPLAGVWILIFVSLGCYRWVMRGD